MASTAVMLFGISLVYGVDRQRALRPGRAASQRTAPGHAPATSPTSGSALTLVGFAFKVSAVPFHFWTPDTYAGAPVPVAAYLSVVPRPPGSPA